ncbi:MAG: hypothetical protein PHU05_00870 [Bacilli bacterium]|nr:hypothetical protein [Bacilli bacterium]
MNKKNIFIITIIIIVVALLGYVVLNFNNKKLSYVSISINPDIMLAVNDANIVEEVIPLNEDADIIISDLEIVGMDIESASKKVIDAAIETGYIDEYSDENIIVVTATNEQEQERQRLEKKVIDSLNDNLEERKIFPIIITGVSDEMKEEALLYGISNGKMLLVSRAASLDPTLDKEQLATLSVKEIQNEIKESIKVRHEALNKNKEELKNKFKEEKDNLKKTYREKIQQMEKTLLEDYGFDKDEMKEDEIRDAIIVASKDIKAEIKERVKEIREELKSNSKNETYNEVKNKIKNFKGQKNQK